MGKGSGSTKDEKRRSAKEHNRNVRKPARKVSTLEIIDRLLLAMISVTMNGVPTRVSTLEAIILQLVLKESAGDLKATKVLGKFEQLRSRPAADPLEVVYQDSAYTRALAGGEGADV